MSAEVPGDAGLALAVLLDALTDPTVVLEPVRDEEGRTVDFVVTGTNQAFDEFLGVPQRTASGLLLTDLQRGTGTGWLLEAYARVLDTGEPLVLDEVPRTSPERGEVRYYDLRANRVGSLLGVTFRDVTTYRQMTEDLKQSEARFRLLAENASDLVFRSEGGVLTWVSPSVHRLLHRTPEEVIGRRGSDLLHPDDLGEVVDVPRLLEQHGEASYTARVVDGDGEHRWLHVTMRAVHDDEGQPLGEIGSARDVTVEQHQRAELEYRALHDPLTGLYNRTWILDMLDHELRASGRTHGTVAALFVDLDNFKVINDSLGHSAGDDVLCAVAARIAATVRARDYAARLGGDEFLVVAAEIDGPAEVEALAARLAAAINDTLEIGGHPLVVGASVGVALSQADSSSASLLRDADSALFRAKADGRGRWQFFDDTMHTAALNRLTLESELRTAIAERQFLVHYQPIVTLGRGDLAGYEALVRWQHPRRGLVPPGEFLAVAEETGLIIDIGGQVLDQVCRLLAARPDLPGTISVNKSPLQINRGDWREHFEETIGRHATDPRRLVIEVTESAVLSRIDHVVDDLAHMRDIGVGLHVDDFGTGYSSIALLRELPVTGIKLDRSFTQHLVDDRQARVVAAGLASLADGLDLVSVAEGIEEPAQAMLLEELGWTHGQGYLYGRPAAEPETPRNLATSSRGGASVPQARRPEGQRAPRP